MFRCLLLFLFTAALPAVAMDGFYQIGFGTQSKGMGGVAYALPQDSFAAAANPAGMAWVGRRLDAGFDWLHLVGSTQIPGGRFSSARSLFFPEAALNWPMSCYSVGFAAYLKGAFNVSYSHPLEIDGITATKGRWVEYFFSPCVALRAHKNFSFGIALNVALASLSFSDLLGRETRAGCGLTFGWFGEFLERLRLGLTYQTPTWHSRRRLNNPGKVGVGIAVVATPYLIFAFDLEGIFWDNTRGFGTILGWRDAIVPKLGLSYEVNDCLKVRFGYNYSRCPITPDVVLPNILTLATPEHHLTAGLSLRIRCHLFSFAYIQAFPRLIGGSVPALTSIGDGRLLLRGHHEQFSFSYGHCF